MDFKKYISEISGGKTAFAELPKGQQITEESLVKLENVIASHVEENGNTRGLSEIIASQELPLQ